MIRSDVEAVEELNNFFKIYFSTVKPYSSYFNTDLWYIDISCDRCEILWRHKSIAFLNILYSV